MYFSGFIFFTLMVVLLFYVLYYLPSYIFCKRMMKNGREEEILYMINKYGLTKLIHKSWFLFKEKTGLEKHVAPAPKNVGSENKPKQ